jgi:hypothetical protein
MLRVGLVRTIYLFFCSYKRLATPLAFAESQSGVEKSSPSIRRYFIAIPGRQKASEKMPALAERSGLVDGVLDPAATGARGFVNSETRMRNWEEGIW